MYEGFIQKVQLSIKEIKVIPHMNINARECEYALSKSHVENGAALRC